MKVAWDHVVFVLRKDSAHGGGQSEFSFLIVQTFDFRFTVPGRRNERNANSFSIEVPMVCCLSLSRWNDECELTWWRRHVWRE